MIRNATLDDVENVLALWRDAYAEPTHTDDPEGVGLLLRHDPEAVLLAEVDGRLVGSVIAAWDGWRGTIYRLVVASHQRRQGVGNELLRRAEARLAKLGARRLQAIVVENNPGATGFWRASDWEEQTQRLRFVRG